MAIEETINNVDSLFEVMESLAEDQREELRPGEYKRKVSRCRLAIPIRMRLVTEQGPGPAFNAELRDISENGLGVHFHMNLTADQLVDVELCINNIAWEGRMRIVHCTRTLNGYKIGLYNADPKMPPKQQRSADDALVRRLRNSVSLQQMRSEIKTAMRAYSLAYKSYGLLGSNVKKKIRQVLGAMPTPTTQEMDGSPRRTVRYEMQGDVHLVVPTSGHWRWIQARVVDVSEGGVGLRVDAESLNDPVEAQLSGEFKFSNNMFTIIGLGTAPNILWVPARLVHIRNDEECDGMLRIGARLETDNIMKELEG